MNIDPWAIMPVHMQRLVRESEARDANEAELAELARQDEAASRAIMARHAENVHIAMTGHSTSDWMAAQQQRATALAEAGYDPSAPAGTPQHPEVLIDGGSLSPNSAQAAVAQATRYGTVSGIDAQLSRNAEERAAWDSPPCRRQRELSLQNQLARESAAGPGRTITRAAASVPAPAPPVATWTRDPRLPFQSLPAAVMRLEDGDW